MASDLSLGSVSQPTPENMTLHRSPIARRVFAGSFLGLTWGASLRAWMVLLALELGDNPRFTWSGTFGAVLFPTALVGALLGAAAHDAEVSDRKRWRWTILSPLLLIVGPVIVTKGFFTTLAKTGKGGGSIGVALIGVFGGYAFSGLGARWARRVSGFLSVSFAIASVFPVYFADQESAAMPSTSKVFGALLFALLMVLLIVGVSAPSRKARR